MNAPDNKVAEILDGELFLSHAATPILDRQAPLPPPAAPPSAGPVVALLTLCLAVPVGIALWHPELGRSLRSWLWVLLAPMVRGDWTPTRILFTGLSCVVAAWSIVVVHELGHVAGGLVVGFRFDSLAIGLLRFDRPFRVSWQRGPLTWSGGWASMFPIKEDRRRDRALVMVAAGPLACVVAGSVVLLLPFAKGLGSVVFVAAGIGNLLELLPIRAGGVMLDGARIAMLMRNGAWGERWLALMKLAAEFRAGVVPESLSPSELAKAVALRDDSLDTLTAHAMAYSAAFHRRDDARAAGMLEVVLRHAHRAAPALREGLMSDAAVFQARRRRRPDLAEQWLADIPATPASAWLRLRAEAAILEARDDVPGALAKLDQYEETAAKLPNRAQRDLVLRALRRWQDELRVRQSA
jgi:Peptidase family M50